MNALDPRIPWASLCRAHDVGGPTAIESPFASGTAAVLTDGRAMLYVVDCEAPAALEDAPTPRSIQEMLGVGPMREVATDALVNFLTPANVTLTRRPRRTICPCRRSRECKTCDNTGDGKAWREWTRSDPVGIGRAVIDAHLFGRYLAGGLAIHRPSALQLADADDRVSVACARWTIVCMGIRWGKATRTFVEESGR